MVQLRRWCSTAMARFYYVLAEGYRYFGNRYYLQAEYQHAVDAYTRAIVHQPNYARAYMARGILNWREMGDPQGAILDLTRAYDLDATLIEARFNRGIAYQQLRAYGDAVADFQVYLDKGDHPHWRDYAERMLKELAGWVSDTEEGDPPGANDR
jgi:tetratricopeptide (TPR) repeat protein